MPEFKMTEVDLSRDNIDSECVSLSDLEGLLCKNIVVVGTEIICW